MTISYKKFNAFLCTLIASLSAQAMEMPTDTWHINTEYLIRYVTAICNRENHAATQDELTDIEQFLRHGAKPNGDSLLTKAARSNQISLARLLLDHNASIDELDGSNFHRTPLEVAVIHNHEPMVLLLLNRKANVEYSLPGIVGELIEHDPINYPLIACFLRHPQAINRTLICSPTSLEGAKERIDKAQWLTYYADVPEWKKKIMECTTFSSDVANIAAEYAAEYAAYGYPKLPGRPTSAEDLAEVAKISAMIPTSEAINKAVLEKE